jgi:hypothetical protein
MSILDCALCLWEGGKGLATCELCAAAEGAVGIVSCLFCLWDLFDLQRSCSACADVTFPQFQLWLTEPSNQLQLVAAIGGNMPCSTTHSTKVQGAGLCCAAVASGALTPPPPGTILPAYTPGQASTLPPGRITTVTDSGGHCASCMIVGSRSAKHPGRPVLKFIRGGPSCPTAGTGCCAMAAA